jgi:multidrug efflux pump subunit AcrA (membrane-fusion protein)
MKSLKLFPFLFLLAACTGGTPKYDATGTFEATEVIVSAEASGKLLSFDIEEGATLKDGQEVGIIDTVQLYLKKLQLEASVKSVEGQRPDILKQVAATQEQIVQARRERDRVSNLLRVGAANQKQLDDAESLLEVLRKQLWQVAAFCGVRIHTYAILSNHFHVLLMVPQRAPLSDAELLRRYRTLYPSPTKFQAARLDVIEAELRSGGPEGDAWEAVTGTD